MNAFRVAKGLDPLTPPEPVDNGMNSVETDNASVVSVTSAPPSARPIPPAPPTDESGNASGGVPE